jgi:hypothetical protein
MTKYEYQKQQLESRKKHAGNLADLNSQLEEAKGILSTIRRLERTYENEKNERETRKEIRRIEALIKDEQAAYNKTFQADPESIKEVVKNITL